MFGRQKSKQVEKADLGSVLAMRQGIPDRDGVFRAIPMEIWDGPHGDMLREIGLYPDNPINLTLENKGLIDTRIDRALEVQKRFLDKLNANINEVAPGVSVVPLAMVPWSVWNGQAAPFLFIVCNMYPPEMWNVFLMPADEKSADYLGMPIHPYREIKGVEENCTRLLLELHEEHRVVFNETSMGLEKGDFSVLDTYQESRNKTLKRILMMAYAITAELFGQEVYERHKELFFEHLVAHW